MKAKILYLLPAIAMLIACGSNKESSSESSQQSSGSESVSESQQSESSETSQQSSERSSEELSSEEASSSEEISSEEDEYKTVEFIPSDFGKEMDAQGDFTKTAEGLTLDAKNSKLHKEHNSGKIELRVYIGGSITFSATSIKSISFVTYSKSDDKEGKDRYSADSLESDIGTYVSNDSTGTWTGEAASVEFSAPSVQVRIKSFTVTYK